VVSGSDGAQQLCTCRLAARQHDKLVVATGIANIYARDWVAASSAQKALNEQSAGRFLLGLGVSHSPLVEGFRGQHYGKPVETMRAYLEGMKNARYTAAPPPAPPKTIIAALGPKMLALSQSRPTARIPTTSRPNIRRRRAKSWAQANCSARADDLGRNRPRESADQGA